MQPKSIGQRGLIVLLALLTVASHGNAQEVTINGTVRDLNAHYEIRNVNIFIKDTSTGVSNSSSGRYSLTIMPGDLDKSVVFRHVAYETREISIDTLRHTKVVYLQPRVIPLQGVEISGEGFPGSKIKNDIPLVLSVIDNEAFEIQGFVDAGDLLKTDYSIQIEEDLSGQKTAAIRGGNPEEVVVLYNGIKLNNSFDKVFDFSLINLEDVDRFEIIKGSNSALYGAEGFSGVINIVPKLEKDYKIRFQQKLGTYQAGNWGLHLHNNLGPLFGSYSIKQGGYQRQFANQDTISGILDNASLHHEANLSYVFGSDEIKKNTLSTMWFYTKLDHQNSRDNRTLDNSNQLFSMRYTGDLFFIKGLDFSMSHHELDEALLTASNKDKVVDDRSTQINTEKQFGFKNVDWVMSYQFQHTNTDYDRTRNQTLLTTHLQRDHHGLATVIKYHGKTASEFVKTMDFDLSLRYDRIDDGGTFPGENGITNLENQDNAWRETTAKFALNISGYKDDLTVDGFMSIGSNTMFPTLLQMSSVANNAATPTSTPNLNPQKNQGLEIGFDLTKDMASNSALDGLQFSATYFRNSYENKLRTFHTIGTPDLFYDNVKFADITGLESKSSAFLFHKKLTLELGYSRYFVSEKAAFPFKFDFKRTVNMLIEHVGYSLRLLWFKEGEQVGWFRDIKNVNEFDQVTLPSNSDIDIHLSKTLSFGKLKIFSNFSGRNLFNNGATELQGLAIHDRRFYITVGAQY